MRTTLTIDDDVLSVAKTMAAAGKVSTGKALSQLARRGYQASVGTHRVNGFLVFDVPDDAPTIYPQQTKEAEVAEDVERYGGQLQ